MKKPFFSIITCTYNSASYLAKNLQSVASQSYRNFEHIIVDGFSSDQSWSIAQDYAKSNSNVIIRQSEAKGIANAMNLGIKVAQGKWLTFLNSDDVLNNPNVLQNVYNFISRHPAPWYYGQAKYTGDFDRQQNIYPWRWYHRHFFYHLLFFINFINHQAVFLHHNLFIQYGLYREDLMGGLDYEYWLRIGKKEKPKFLPILIADFRVGGFSTNPENKDFNWHETIKIRKLYTKFASLTLWPMWIYQKIRKIK